MIIKMSVTGHAQHVEAIFSTDVYLSFIAPTSNALKNWNKIATI